MNIETVNELIRSLESAGELSIREQKFLKLAKAFKQLAAENVAQKSFGDKLNDMHNALNGEGTGIQGRAEVACQQVALEAAIEEFDAIETPATDRIVAGIKADGVEMFALMFAEEAIKDNNITTGWKARASRAASEYAELLREGADK
ncbi:hypothetical protein SB00001_03844 [Klebsiella variicola]|uniref:hypothetical protein n=1 Tax=Klebsiella variicola TaxID=244366 RepID=UPI00109CD9E4|nr:hypothetical protein [Klebsiella variicola]UDC22506.1 hypothetical protein LGN95_20005 [Klebsiella variicola subsp. variicola]VGP35220.1 hypothetical protein SB00001_03844 [Klebsiella variicola]